MCQKTEKHVKLVQVYNEISHIKAQIYSLMQPNLQPNPNTVVNINIVPPNQTNQQQKQVINQSTHKEGYKDVIVKGAKCPAHYTSLKYLRSPLHQQKNQKETRLLCQQNRNPFTGQILFSNHSPKFPVYSKQNHKTKYPPPANVKRVERLKTETQVQVIKRQPESKAMVQKNSKIRYLHTRHKSQVELNNYKQLRKSKSNDKLHAQSQQAKEFPFKHSFLNKRVTNTIKEEKEEKEEKQENGLAAIAKRLIRRVRGDCVDVPKENSQKRDLSLNSSQKIKFLQEQIKKKNEIIDLLSGELQQIQRNFSQMQANLRKVLSNRLHGSKQIQQGQLNQAIQQILKELQQNRNEIKRLGIQNYSVNQKIASFEQEKAVLKSRLQNLASKLEVAVNQNRLKDEFIINYLLTKNQEQEKEGWVSQTLQNYLEKIGYPNNRLLQKLCSEQQEIQNLQRKIENLTKK